MVDSEGIEETSRKKVIVFLLWFSISITHIAPNEILCTSLGLPLYTLVFGARACYKTTLSLP